jgi:hypothetical protein
MDYQPVVVRNLVDMNFQPAPLISEGKYVFFLRFTEYGFFRFENVGLKWMKNQRNGGEKW